MNNPSSKQLEELSKKLEEQRKNIAPTVKEEAHISAAQAGWRMVTELVVGVLLGAAIGYGLDTLFETLPLFLIVFCLLGFAAGVRTMMRSAQEIEAKNNSLAKAEKK